ncbi:MAG: hypothetical protein GY862_06525 [Gammaproteobacteria bacterium]|nr:hypothetical protein [Gammaproteobacteria bacterium]
MDWPGVTHRKPKPGTELRACTIRYCDIVPMMTRLFRGAGKISYQYWGLGAFRPEGERTLPGLKS